MAYTFVLPHVAVVLFGMDKQNPVFEWVCSVKFHITNIWNEVKISACFPCLVCISYIKTKMSHCKLYNYSSNKIVEIPNTMKAKYVVENNVE